MEFTDEPAPPARGPRPRPRRPRRPERQQIMMRRALALGAGLVILILIVLGVKGCLNARKHRALSDYARDVSQIVTATKQTSKSFFGKLEDPGKLSVREFVNEVNADRSAMDTYVSRVQGLDAPGDMSRAQSSLELSYELRGAAMTEIANRMSTALGTAGAEKARGAIAHQLQTMLAGDVVYAAVARPEINGVLADNGIEGDDVPRGAFLSNPLRWLDPSEVDTALDGVTGSTAAAGGGVHGLGLISTSIDDTTLTAGVPATVSASGTPQVTVEVQNQGDSTETGVTVGVTVNGAKAKEKTIPSIASQATESVTIPLTPTPSGQATIDVEVQPVPGEQVSSNNSESYTVDFE